MTLDTRIRIVEPMPVKPLFDECRRLIGGEQARYRHVTELTERWQRNPFYANDVDQGLPALLSIDYGPDGPLREYAYEDDEDESPEWLPKACIEVSFDTAYGYRAANGAGCADLHAWLIVELGRWLDARGVTWYWQNEFTGEWHAGLDDATVLVEFGNPIKGAPGMVPGTVCS